MNTFRKASLLAGICVPAFTSMSICSIEGEGDEGAGGGSGSSDGGQSDGKADSDEGLTTSQKLEKEFGQEITPDDGSDDSSGEGSDEDGDGDEADGEEGEAEGAEEGAEGEEQSEQSAEGAAAPKKGRAQERIDELTAQSRTHEREAEKWREIALKHGATDAEEGPTIPDEPDPEQYAYGEHDVEYIKDQAKFDTKMEMLTEQATAKFKAEASALDAKWTKNLAGAVERFPDFDEVVVKGSDKWACPPVIAIGIKDSEVGPDIAYALAKDPAEADRISKLSPLEQAREFGKKEEAVISAKRIVELEAKIAKLEGKGPDGKPQTKPNIVSKAPEPPRRRVAGGGSRHEIPADTDDFAAFEAKADKILGMKSK